MPAFKLFFKQLSYRKASIILYFVLFFGLLGFFATLGGTASQDLSFDESSLVIGIADQDQTETSKGIVSFLSNENTVSMISGDSDTLKNYLYQYDTNAILVIPKGYEESLLAGKPKALETGSALGAFTSKYLLDAKLNDFMGNVQIYLKAGGTVNDALDKTTSHTTMQTEVTRIAKSATTDIDQGDMPFSFFYYRYIAYIFVALMLAAVGPTIVAFYKKNLYMRSMCSGTKNYKYHLQLALGIMIFMVAVCVLLNAIGIIAGKSTMSSQQVLLSIINTTTLALGAVSITCLCGFISKNENTMSGFANVVSLVFAFLGGVFVPISFLGKGIIKVAKFIPTYWYTTANNMIFSAEKQNSAGMSTILQSILIQLVIAGSLFAVALLISRKKIQSSSL